MANILCRSHMAYGLLTWVRSSHQSLIKLDIWKVYTNRICMELKYPSPTEYSSHKQKRNCHHRWTPETGWHTYIYFEYEHSRISVSFPLFQSFQLSDISASTKEKCKGKSIIVYNSSKQKCWRKWNISASIAKHQRVYPSQCIRDWLLFRPCSMEGKGSHRDCVHLKAAVNSLSSWLLTSSSKGHKQRHKMIRRRMSFASMRCLC